MLHAEGALHVAPVFVGVFQQPLRLIHAHLRDHQVQVVGAVLLHDAIHVFSQFLKPS